MVQTRGTFREGGISGAASWVALMGALVAAGSCRGLEKATGQSPAAVLRVGLGQAPTNPQNGVRQITMNLSVESLGRLAEDGRVEPQLADKWTLGRDGRSLTVTLKHGVSFHDGSPVNARTVSPLLPAAMKTFAGPVFDDIESIYNKLPPNSPQRRAIVNKLRERGIQVF